MIAPQSPIFLAIINLAFQLNSIGVKQKPWQANGIYRPVRDCSGLL